MAKPKIRLYVTDDLVEGQRLFLSDQQNHYLRNVMRCQIGHHVILFNGKDGAFLAELTELSKKEATVIIKEQLAQYQSRPEVVLVMAPLKKDAMDIMLEKSTEIGVSAILPVITEYTQSERLNRERMSAQMIEAAEQSERLDVPELLESTKLRDFLQALKHPLIFCDESLKDKAAFDIPHVMRVDLKNKTPVMVLIGPEGGFSEAERQLLRTHPLCYPVSLGQTVLRAETAAICALILIFYALSN